jgi:hypothetical protein
MARSEEEAEIRRVLRERVRSLEQLSWEELDRYQDRTEMITTASGAEYRVVSGANWETKEWDSGMELFAKAHARKGWRRWFPYTEWASRGGPDDPVPERPGPTARRTGPATPDDG